jgi:hypothetical protein
VGSAGAGHLLKIELVQSGGLVIAAAKLPLLQCLRQPSEAILCSVPLFSLPNSKPRSQQALGEAEVPTAIIEIALQFAPCPSPKAAPRGQGDLDMSVSAVYSDFEGSHDENDAKPESVPAGISAVGSAVASAVTSALFVPPASLLADIPTLALAQPRKGRIVVQLGIVSGLSEQLADSCFVSGSMHVHITLHRSGRVVTSGVGILVQKGEHDKSGSATPHVVKCNQWHWGDEFSLGTTPCGISAFGEIY